MIILKIFSKFFYKDEVLKSDFAFFNENRIYKLTRIFTFISYNVMNKRKSFLSISNRNLKY